MLWLTVLVLVSAAFADDSKASDNGASYGVAETQPMQVQQIPIYGRPSHNVPAYANVKAGRHHGAFLDGYINNYSKSTSDESKSDSRDSKSEESYERRPKRQNRRYNYGSYYPSAPAWPNFGQQYPVPMSNPFFVPKYYRRRHNRKNYGSNSDKDYSY